MLAPSFALLLLSAVQSTTAALTKSNLETHVDTLALDFEFGPVKEAYWTSIPHHRRTPFAVSPDGKSAYLAYLDSSETDVHVQQVDPTTFAATGTTVTVSGAKEAGGLVAHDDGFAILVNEAMPSGTTNAPPSDTPVAVLYRYTSGKQTWKTWLGGPGVHEADGLSASPDMNGDLVYSAEAGLYGAYFVVTDYSGDASGHFGDSIEYVKEDGTLSTIDGASSSWGCSHNTGIAFEAADAAPFASICAEDQGAIWLNTGTSGMTTAGQKISNENTTNGGSGEPMGGMSGSFSGLARFGSSSKYIFSWVSRGAKDVVINDWMGDGYTHVTNRTNNRNIAISVMSDKSTLAGEQATSTVGSTDGDSQVNWIKQGDNDCQNAHVATFGEANALVTWEEAANPVCPVIAMGCMGEFQGTFFQQVDSTGAKVGDAFSATDVYVAGDMVTMSDGRICWPYVSMTWDVSTAVSYGGSTSTSKKMSFACMSLDGSSSSSAGASSAVTQASSSTPAAAVSSAASSAVSTPEASATTEAAGVIAEASSSTTPVAPATPTTLQTQTRSSTQVDVPSTAAATSVAPTAAVSSEAAGVAESTAAAATTATGGWGNWPSFTPGAAWPTSFPGFGTNKGTSNTDTDATSSSSVDGASTEEEDGPCAVEYVYV
ncbi:muc1 extracellular alpha glucan glucosidase-like [Diplodia corticola]|uniref:Muc1 extracellular alpha glucan glucosidase-like n=1 Tax=Diplodia corticola TaxID=236234 RepID=A0A1J9R4L0_9PEZI|nr:muc1 extracellular alpha glucan glucosidase-like [Diplodia corticola]OJD35536.1 muc1 extracellular alpha glucan glucosidase-like [Diplodia corticola]